jgi:hypothetical protein
LELDGGADRLARRAEHAECLVAAELEQGAASCLDDLASDLGDRLPSASSIGGVRVPFDILLGRGTYEVFSAFWPNAPEEAGGKPMPGRPGLA